MENTKHRILKTIPEWLKIIPSLNNLSQREKDNYKSLMNFAITIPDIDKTKNVVLVKCPGRYRDFAGHTDMKGCGGVLCGSASAEAIYGLYQIRTDRKVILHNSDSNFQTKTFPISSTKTGLSLSKDWNSWDNWTTQQYEKNGNDPEIYGPKAWDKYIKGLLILLSELPAEIRKEYSGDLPGFTGVYTSDLTYGGGKSSSSALVVNAALGLDALFEYDKPSTDEWIDLIGMSEWFTMTRGGVCGSCTNVLFKGKPFNIGWEFSNFFN